MSILVSWCFATGCTGLFRLHVKRGGAGGAGGGAFAITAPAGAVKGETISVAWSELPGASSYQLWLQPSAQCVDGSAATKQSDVNGLQATVAHAGDGTYFLCVWAISGSNLVLASNSPYQVVVDNQAPTAGQPASFALVAANPAVASLTWSEAQDGASGIAKQEINFFGDGNTSCSGTADETLVADATATSYDWQRFVAGVKGMVRFNLKVTDGAGNSATSNCSGSAYVRNGVMRFTGGYNQLGLGQSAVVADVTGDGYDDVVTAYSLTEASRGSVSILVGGQTMASGKVITYLGEVAGEPIANTLTSLRIGDVNGDGIKDIVVGSSGFQSNKGRIYVVFGRSNMPASGSIGSVASRIYDGDNTGDHFGSQNHLHDVTGDGVLDLVAAAPGSGVANTGMVGIIVGGASLAASGALTSIGRRYDGPSTSAFFGQYIFFEDITGDGIAEVISGYNGGGGGWGYVGVIKGGASLPASGIISAGSHYYTGIAAASQFGPWANNDFQLEDITGDGIKDILNFASGANVAGNSGAGALHVIPGAATLPASNPITTVGYAYRGNAAFEGAGAAALTSRIADVTGDGIKDVTFGNALFNTLYVVPGASSLPASNTIATVGRRWTGSFILGYITADFDGDGIQDLMISDWTALAVYIVKGAAGLPANGTVAAAANRNYTAASAAYYSSFHFQDINGDAYADLVFYAPTLAPNGANSGSIFVVLGASSMPTSGALTTVATARYDGEAASDNLGNGLVLKDLNNDGRVDLVSASSAAGSNTGSLYVILSSATMPASGTITAAGKRFSPSVTGQYFGASFSFVDVNADGNNDVLVQQNTSATTYESYLLYGGANLAALRLVTIGSSTWGDGTYFGQSVLWGKAFGSGRYDFISFGQSGSTFTSSDGYTSNGAIYVMPNEYILDQ